jgi:hypothetical protein
MGVGATTGSSLSGDDVHAVSDPATNAANTQSGPMKEERWKRMTECLRHSLTRLQLYQRPTPFGRRVRAIGTDARSAPDSVRP